MLPEVAVRDTPGDKGKYLTTLYLSETVTPTGDTATVVAGGQNVRYRKVRLEDGKEGWVRTDFIAIDVIPAVFIAKTAINKRPDLSAVTGKEFFPLDIVAMGQPKNGWVEVKGIAQNDKWFTTGYVRQDNLTFERLDISFAAIYHRAGAATDQKKRDDLFGLLSTTTEFQSSRFYAEVFGADVGEEEFEGDGEDPLINQPWAVVRFNSSFEDEFQDIEFEAHEVVYVNDRDGNQKFAGSFNGTSSYLKAERLPDFPQGSFTFWMNPSDQAAERTILGCGNNCTSGYSLLLDKDSKLVVLCGGVTTDVTHSNYTVRAGEWIFVALVKDENDFSLYVNGELSSNGTSGHNEMTDASSFTLGAGTGCDDSDVGDFYAGLIDDLTIYRKPLSADEVKEKFSGN